MKKIFILLTILLLLSSCSSSKSEPINKQQSSIYFLSDENGNVILDEDGIPLTPLNTSVWITTTNSKLNDDMVKDFTNLIRKYHYLFDSHHNFEGVNNIKTINDNYGLEPVKVDQEIINILKEAIEISKESDGLFNPTIGALSNVYSGMYDKSGGHKDPDEKIINSAKACVIPSELLEEYIVIDENNSTVLIKKYDSCTSSVSLSLGAISKGYALDKIYDELLKYNSGFLISAGGSSTITYVAENQMNDLSWKIGITDPKNPDSIYSIMELKTSFISTSGDYQQYYINDEGIIRHHILNPDTGYPENYYRSITLVGSSGGSVLDALSTSIYSTKDYEKYLSKFNDKYNLDIQAYIIAENENGDALPIYNSMDCIIQ